MGQSNGVLLMDMAVFWRCPLVVVSLCVLVAIAGVLCLLLSMQAKKKTEDSFQIDLDDSRFAAIYNSSEYAVDPSHPQYKPTKSMAALVLERQRRLQKEEREDSRVEEGVSEAKRKRPTSQTRELQQLVKSIKSKTKGKTKKKRTIM
jgi:hypothetical protein